MIETLPLLGPGDYAALAVLILAWALTTARIEWHRTAKPSVSILMERYRRDWMAQMAARSDRAFDVLVLSNLRQGSAFFASGSLVALGGVLALAGNVEQIQAVAGERPFLHAGPGVWQLKMVFAALLLTHAFLEFVWSNRLFGYCAVVVASVPPGDGDWRALDRAGKAASINIRAAMHLNRGLRSVYFALAVLAWLIGWAALVAAVLAVSWVLWWREFASESRAALLED